MLPIEIINKILVYCSELNNDMIITQYYIISNKEYYKINFNSESLWKIKGLLRMKQLYPLYDNTFSNNNIKFYKSGVEHYKTQLKLMNK